MADPLRSLDAVPRERVASRTSPSVDSTPTPNGLGVESLCTQQSCIHILIDVDCASSPPQPTMYTKHQSNKCGDGRASATCVRGHRHATFAPESHDQSHDQSSMYDPLPLCKYIDLPWGPRAPLPPARFRDGALPQACTTSCSNLPRGVSCRHARQAHAHVLRFPRRPR